MSNSLMDYMRGGPDGGYDVGGGVFTADPRIMFYLTDKHLLHLVLQEQLQMRKY